MRFGITGKLLYFHFTCSHGCIYGVHMNSSVDIPSNKTAKYNFCLILRAFDVAYTAHLYICMALCKLLRIPLLFPHGNSQTP